MASVDDQEYSDLTRIGELPPRVIDRYVAVLAATHLVDPRDRERTKEFAREFLTWLDDGFDGHGERELRRAVLLAVTRGWRQHGVSANDFPEDVRKVVEDTFNHVA